LVVGHRQASGCNQRAARLRHGGKCLFRTGDFSRYREVHGGPLRAHALAQQADFGGAPADHRAHELQRVGADDQRVLAPDLAGELQQRGIRIDAGGRRWWGGSWSGGGTMGQG
jgi:hypothetical protein